MTTCSNLLENTSSDRPTDWNRSSFYSLSRMDRLILPGFGHVGFEVSSFEFPAMSGVNVVVNVSLLWG